MTSKPLMVAYAVFRVSICDAFSHNGDIDWERYPAFALDRDSEEFVDYYNESINTNENDFLELNFDQLRKSFADAPEATRANGLNHNENSLLWYSNDLSDSLKLVLKGLINRFGK